VVYPPPHERVETIALNGDHEQARPLPLTDPCAASSQCECECDAS